MDNLTTSASTAGIITAMTPNVQVYVLFATAILLSLALGSWIYWFCKNIKTVKGKWNELIQKRNAKNH